MKIKKIIALLLCSSILMASFTACTSEETTTEGETTTETTEGTTEETTTETLDLSSYFTELGYFNGVTATDYVTLPDYQNATLPEDVITVSEEEFQAEVDLILSSYTIQEPVTDADYEIAEGDLVNIDYVGSVDGVEFEGGSTQGAGTDVTAGSADYIDDFLTQIIGHKIGENFDIEVTFPEEYGNEELNGKDAVFNITINHTYETVTPEFTDEFVAETFAGVYDDAAALTDAINENILYSKQTAYINDLLNESEISEIPQEILTFVEESHISTITSQAAQYGMDLATYLSALQYENLDAYLADSLELFEENAKLNLVYQAVMETEEYDLTEDKVKEYTDLLFGEGTYEVAEPDLGYNYIAYIVSQNIGMEQVHRIMIENTDGAVLPSFYN